MATAHLISTEGSDRATGYSMSAKLVRREDRLFIGWLDAAPTHGDPARIMFGARDAATGAAVREFPLGEGVDNHCGPAFALDRDGRLHAIIGTHHGPFLYRYADNPESPAGWSEPVALGPRDTYPSLVVDASGTLHLAHREAGDRWQLWYRRKRAGHPWEEAQSLAISPVPGYNHYMHSLTVAPDGALHLTFQFYYSDGGSAADGYARAVVYLRSEDGGDVWLGESGRPVTTSVTIETMEAFYRRPHDAHPSLHDLRAGNHIVDARGRPWMFLTLPDAKSGSLWTRDDDAWRTIDLEPMLSPLNLARGRATSLAADAEGRMHLLFATDPDGIETQWYDARHELFHLALSPEGEKLSLARLTEREATSAWLPALEPWSWATTPADRADGPWYLYTRGENAGGIGGDNASAVKTRVYLDRLDVDGGG
ncbi:hypothetical protein HN371_11435 [Candidatus Poribacteria bacterium]|nr:hypothetical protein [Candidatus Poribacteria bacterium]MBT5532598.1 hypothetical protein [Candidatus Poribacteria bacterium]MBT5713690.1 hypothetical protein [Candidatus Poribacteria bacterium]MBT7097221.1 hypothetical protein [Candidatus Poribacteria bacterium]MBT7807442.1 hypothetical protein [Candidatus Poribacteria bacterium]